MACVDLEAELSCPLCCDLFEDPVKLECGQNFCWVCIDRTLDSQEGFETYYCPLCCMQFKERPVLQKNTTLCNLIEKFLALESQEVRDDIACTYCINCPVPADKSCQLCEAFLCYGHLKVHSKAAEHVLTDLRPTWYGAPNYCSTGDPECTCLVCSVMRELRHEMEMPDEASEKKKKKLKEFLQKLSAKREKAEKRVYNLEEHKRKAQEKAAGDAEKVTALFTDMRRKLDDLENKVLREISRQEEQVSLPLSALIQKLEIKKDELSRKIRPIEELCKMTDPPTTLQESDTGDLSDPEEENEEDTGGQEGSHWSVEAISHISHSLSNLIRDVNVTLTVTFCSQEDPTDILLDLETAANNIHISHDLKIVSRVKRSQNRPEIAKRFQYFQVMSSSSISSGQHYWDVESSTDGMYWIGMCYPSIDRKGRQSYIGNNNKSWSLYVGLGYSNRCKVSHDSEGIMLPHQISAVGLRVYVDYEAGQLSFYELCDPIRHLHTFTATFTEPLHAVLCIWGGCIKISDRKGAAAAMNYRDRRNLNKKLVRLQGAESDR